MVILIKRTLQEYAAMHSDITEPLNNWYVIAKKAQWKNFTEIKEAFNSVDTVGNDRFVFNIKGNKYRLVVLIHFDIRTIYIRFIGTHAEYDKIDCKTI
jgi:mRNA interferase HigB